MTTQMTAENIEQLLETNPEAVDMSDPAVIALINKLSGDDPAAGDESEARTDPDGEQEDAAAKAAAEEAAKKAAEEAAAKAQAEAAKPVIKSKDGKHDIPYDVLEQERAEKEAAVAAAKQLAAVVNAMEEEIKRLRADGGAKSTDAQPAVHPLRAALDAARLKVEEVEKEYPDIAPAQKALLESMTTMAENLFTEVNRQSEVIEALRKHAEQTQAERQGAVKETAKDALAQVPALVVWQTKNKDLFALATSFDNTLKVDPEWKGKPLVDRFKKAVEMVVAVRGPKVLDGIAPTQPQKDTKTDAGKKSGAEAIAAALGITSLSDLPGGSPVSQEAGGVDGLSDSQLVEKVGSIRDNSDLLQFLAGAVT